MLPPDFAQTGFAAIRASDASITKFQVLGERASGTNYVKRLIGRNTPLSHMDVLGWKHGLPHMLAIPRDLAVICVVRRADNWARSLFETPWHSTPALQALPFSAFIRAPWDTRIDKAKHFEGLMAPGTRGTPLQHDRDPLTGAMFDNIFALRRAKLTGLLSLMQRDCTAIVLRMEDAQAAPEALLDRIAPALGISRHKGYNPVVKRQGWRFKPLVQDRPALPDAWSVSDYDFLKSQIDPTLEALLGYAYTDPPAITKREVGRAWHDS